MEVWEDGPQQDRDVAVELCHARQQQIYKTCLAVSTDTGAFDAEAYARREQSAQALFAPSRMLRRMAVGRLPSRSLRLASVVSAAMLRPRLPQMVEEYASVIRTPVEEHRASADGTVSVRIEVTLHRPALVVRPAERRCRIVLREVRDASPMPATASGVSTEPQSQLGEWLAGLHMGDQDRALGR